MNDWKAHGMPSVGFFLELVWGCDLEILLNSELGIWNFK